METDLFDLNLDFLMKAREWLLSGNDHKAQVLLRLSPEAATLLKRLPLNRIRDLAASGTLCYTVRLPPQVWKDLALTEPDRALPESLRWQWLVHGTGIDDDGAP